MRWIVQRSRIEGTCVVPGDKSIAHRALMLAALAEGASHVRCLPDSDDVRSTASCLRGLGVEIGSADGVTTVTSSGRLQPSSGALDAGNSGTTMRLLAGILAGQPFESHLTGDSSLRRRPMDRVVTPLSLMGARISADAGRAPLRIQGGDLKGIRYALPVASAQVKSAVLLAGLFAAGQTTVVEPIKTRDHTERMLLALGVGVARSAGTVSVAAAMPHTFDGSIPGDISSASFLFAAAALTGGDVTVDSVGVNPTRTGFLEVLRRMGIAVERDDGEEEMGEPVGQVRVHGSITAPISLGADEIPLMIDELPLVALLATAAPGVSMITGAAELRYKETDRIATVGAVLRAMGADLEEQPDGFVVRGPTPLRGTVLSSQGDHRLAMLSAVAASAAEGETVIEGAEAADVSFPSFAHIYGGLGAYIEASNA